MNWLYLNKRKKKVAKTKDIAESFKMFIFHFKKANNFISWRKRIGISEWSADYGWL